MREKTVRSLPMLKTRFEYLAAPNALPKSYPLKQTQRPKPGFVGASPEGDNANSTPKIGSEKFPNFDKSNNEKKLEQVDIAQKFRLQFAVEPQHFKMLNRIISLLSTKHPQGIPFETIFTVLMEYFFDRHAPENKIKRRNDRKNRSKDHEKISAAPNH